MDTTITDHGPLARNAWTGAAFLLGVLWLMLFFPAWSLGFWQAWIYWAIFSISVILVTRYFLGTDPELIRKRLPAGPGAERERSQKIIQAIMTLAFILLMLLPGIDHRSGWSAVPVWAVIAGDFIVMIGFLIVFLTFRENSFTSAIIEVGEGQNVVSTGPYAIVRHPMYAGASLLILATPFALGSYWDLLPAFLMIAGVALRLLEEERFLTLNLPGYREYCDKTRFRLIPFIW
jgi:protein-S-isoprenylcysteine O-methyltransferase Ste14